MKSSNTLQNLCFYQIRDKYGFEHPHEEWERLWVFIQLFLEKTRTEARKTERIVKIFS